MAEQAKTTNEQVDKAAEAAKEAAAKDAAKKEPTKKTDKPKYKWAVKQFRMPGSDEVISAEDAETDPDLVKQILAIPGQGILKQIY